VQLIEWHKILEKENIAMLKDKLLNILIISMQILLNKILNLIEWLID